MVEHFTRGEVVEQAYYYVVGGLEFNEEGLTSFVNALFDAKLKEWEAQGAVMYGLQAADGRFGNFAYSTENLAKQAVQENPASIGYKVVGYFTHALPAQD